MEKQQVLHILCVCSLRYPVCRARAVLFCHLWRGWLYRIFSTLYKRHVFWKINLLNIKCVFWFFIQLVSETFLKLRRI
jgi:hypothetical protein